MIRLAISSAVVRANRTKFILSLGDKGFRDRNFIAAIGACMKKQPAVYQKLMNELIKRAICIRPKRHPVPLRRRG
jgi:hypothetical protein